MAGGKTFFHPLATGSASSPTGSATSHLVDTEQTRAVDSWGDLTTVGPEVTVTAPASGMLLVVVHARGRNASGNECYMSFEAYDTTAAVSKLVPSDTWAGEFRGSGFESREATKLVTGLTEGNSIRLRAKYRSVTTNTAHWRNRYITVVPL